MASISFKNVKKTYPGGVTVVPELNLDIKDKEFVVLVGPSGCGKSTTLRMIAGLEDITEGELFIGDRLVNNVPPKDRDIAMVFQSYALYPHKTVYNNIAFALKLRKFPKDEIDRRVHEAAKVLDLEHLLDRKPKNLSGGQRQRVALGRAMVRNPAVFLLDEPLSNLDAKLRTAMRSEISKLHKKLDTTFVYVTHDQTEAMTMGDRIVVMKDGVIMQNDTPQMLYDYPDNLFVAGFIGSPQMNFTDAVLQKENGKYSLKVGSTVLPLPEGKGKDADLDSYVGKTVVLGIRPGDFFADPEAGAPIEADVDIAELMGDEINLYVTFEGNKTVIKLPSEFRAKSGDHLRISMKMKKAHLFDKESELAICH